MVTRYNQTGKLYLICGILTIIIGIIFLSFIPVLIVIPLAVGGYYILKAQGYRHELNSGDIAPEKNINPGQRISQSSSQPANSPPCASCGTPLSLDTVSNKWMCENSGCEKYQQKL